MSTVTYKQILTYFSSIALNHEQINSFGFGDYKQITNDILTKQEPKYPRMYVVPEQVQFNQNHIHYNFGVVFMDRVEDDLSNLEEVMSDTLELASDIFTVFYQSYTYEQGDFSKIAVGDWSPEVVPFTERFNTILGGHTLHIKLTIPFDYNSCNLPIVNDFSFGQDESFSSYYQMIRDWKQFAQAHEQVNSFGFGDVTQLVDDVETKVEPLYPRLYFIPETTTLNQNQLDINFDVRCLDRVEDDLSNQQDVLSDTLEIMKDFYAKAYLSDYEVLWNASLNPILQETQTELGGWSLIVTIQQKFDYNRCVLPIDSFAEGITWEELNRRWKEINQEWDSVKKLN